MRRKSVEQQERDLLRALRREVYDAERLVEMGVINKGQFTRRMKIVCRQLLMLELKYGLIGGNDGKREDRIGSGDLDRQAD
jgi:hypothetical protein